ncbi:hypothetical protein D7322_08845 [Sphingobacterium puteale]|uniref:Uncharacterized protein n=1 Tax=Sphingobacterium puteale TaxID=2420510 RepID=A0A420W0U6_9SPHI|nr:hypothetical protein D7322_08845 [Sphingobacterium puteale]
MQIKINQVRSVREIKMKRANCRLKQAGKAIIYSYEKRRISTFDQILNESLLNRFYDSDRVLSGILIHAFLSFL